MIKIDSIKKGLKITIIVVFSLLLILIVGSQILVNSRFAANTINKLGAEYIDGSFGYSKHKVSLWRYFPKVKLELDSLYLGYPHSRYSRYASGQGSGIEIDTLARFDRLTLSINALKAIKGDIYVDDIRLEGLRAYAYQYNSREANWTIFKLPQTAEEEDTTASSFLRSLRLDSLRIDRLYAVYSGRGLKAELSLPKLRLSANARLDTLLVEDSHLYMDASLSLDNKSLKIERADLSMDANALMLKPKELDIDVNSLSLTAPGLMARMKASVDDLMGSDPSYFVQADLHSAVSQLTQMLPSLKDSLELDGSLDCSFDAKIRQSELSSYRFDKSVIHGIVESEGLKLSRPADTLKADVFNARINLNAEPSGLGLDIAFDSVYYHQADALAARLRKISATAQIEKKQVGERLLPVISLGASGQRAFVKMGDNRLGISDLAVSFNAERKNINRPTRRGRADSLGRRVDSLGRRPRPVMQQEFENENFDISLDSSLVKYLNGWTPSGEFKLGRGFVATPQLPLRTRIDGVAASFDEQNVCIDKFALASGSTDISVKGQFKGLWRALRRRSRIEGQLSISSKRLNVNEILAALQKGAEHRAAVTIDPNNENDESFVTDSLEDAVPQMDKMPLIVVPANLNLGLSVNAQKVDLSLLDIAPLSTGLRVQDRTLQLTDTEIRSQLGDVYMNAFYSTKSKSDISAGVDLRLKDIQAHDLIALLPSVEDMMPAIKSFHGKLGCELSGTAKLDTAMNVIMPSVDGLVRITGRDLEVTDVGDLKRITRLLLFKNKNIGHIDDLRVDALIRDNTIEVFPFELAADRYRFALRGTQYMDGTMYYHASVLNSPLLIPFGLNIYGTLDNWRFSLCWAKYRSGNVAVYTQQLDTVQLNFAQSVRNIFKKGVDSVMKHNARSMQGIALDDVAAASQMSSSEYYALEDALMADELQAQQDAVEAEVEAVLQASAIDATKLLKDYQATISDKKIKREIERLKRQSDRKKKDK